MEKQWGGQKTSLSTIHFIRENLYTRNWYKLKFYVLDKWLFFIEFHVDCLRALVIRYHHDGMESVVIARQRRWQQRPGVITLLVPKWNIIGYKEVGLSMNMSSDQEVQCERAGNGHELG